ncbi:MAG: hypothetical protein WCY15_00990 [Phenylobacterium sp.]|jgi:hypothetical protein|uniref:hypothetical protein n=1 Tax=Phenylobacterium sp. TaxID=1871053 RepID=UPI002A2E606A|nr:hypothetical protein [Phenylobacterium sp.]MDD3837648.1 hypothetical protein [Phenylobacterium sp.]MDX9997238.1 hypothetical protein [Phenylobacterium sp.]
MSAVARQIETTEPSRPESRFVAANGRPLRVSCRLEPVLELKAFRRIGYRMARQVIDVEAERPLTVDEILRLTRADLERIDLATLSRGLDRLQVESEGAKELTLILPVSYVSLSNTHGRKALVGYFKQARETVLKGLVCEVTEIEGVPEAGLSAALAAIRPYCLLLVGRRCQPYGDSHILASVGLQGVSVECPTDLADDGEFVHWARHAVDAGKRAARSVMAFGVPSTRHLAIAAHLGASHGSLRSGPVLRGA